jgi:hypothetical protein
MALKPNWFDREFEGPMERATAEEALAEIARSPRVVKAVSDALVRHDANSKKQGWVGPTRTQTVRQAIAEVLQTDA